MTFEELCKLEPALRRLAQDARSERDSRKKPSYCANDVWYCDLKPRLVMLVGWSSRHPASVMHTDEAYDVAYDAIYHLLPNCRNCADLPVSRCYTRKRVPPPRLQVGARKGART